MIARHTRNWYRKVHLIEVLEEILSLREITMTMFDDLKASVATANAKIAAVAADVQRLHDLLANATGGLTAAEAQEIAADLQGIVGQLSTVDDATPEP